MKKDIEKIMDEQSTNNLVIGEEVFYCRPDLNDFTASRGILKSIEGENAFIEGVDVAVPVDVLSEIPKPIVPDIKTSAKKWPLEYIVSEAILDLLGFTLTKFDGQYGVAKSKANGGKKVIKFNLEGISVDYSGNKLPENIAVGIYDDWDSRTTFNGYVCNGEDFKKILELTR
jgi:hypothetical protein